ncbi:hypothetical protein [Streptomyces parvulus]
MREIGQAVKLSSTSSVAHQLGRSPAPGTRAQELSAP